MTEVAVWDEWAQRVYLTSLARDIRYARAALAGVLGRLSQRPADPLLWISMETFLMFSARVSRMLKPIGVDKGPPKNPAKKAAYEWRKIRGEHLCSLLAVNDDSVVLAREVRNASEHFDEHLDAWMAHAPRVTAAQIEAGELPVQLPQPLRHVDPPSRVVEVAGQRLDLVALEGELNRLLERAAAIEPLARWEDPAPAMFLAGLSPMPQELRIDAPTRRPNESVLAGVDPAAIEARRREWDDLWVRVSEAFRRAPDEPGP